MSNLVYITAVGSIADQLPFGIRSWEEYCRIHDIRLIVSDTPMPSNDKLRGNAAWQPWIVDDLIEEEFDKLLLVDVDTIIGPDAPNIFEVATGHFCVIKDADGVKSGNFHLGQWPDFDINQVPIDGYFNTGIICLDREHYDAVRVEIPKYYKRWVRKYADAFEQSPVNIIAYGNFPDRVVYLGDWWNNIVVAKGGFSSTDGTYIWHFAGMTNERRYPLMKALYYALQEDRRV